MEPEKLKGLPKSRGQDVAESRSVSSNFNPEARILDTAMPQRTFISLARQSVLARHVHREGQSRRDVLYTAAQLFERKKASRSPARSSSGFPGTLESMSENTNY